MNWNHQLGFSKRTNELEIQCSIMFAGERQSGKHSRINYFPFDRYSTYFFYHVPKFVFRSKILNHFWTNRTRFQPEFNDSMLIRFFIVKWAAAQHYCSLIETTLSTGCNQNSVRIQSNPCTHSVPTGIFSTILSDLIFTDSRIFGRLILSSFLYLYINRYRVY